MRKRTEFQMPSVGPQFPHTPNMHVQPPFILAEPLIPPLILHNKITYLLAQRSMFRWRTIKLVRERTEEAVAVLYSSSLEPVRAGNGIIVGSDITHIEILAKHSSETGEPWPFPTARMDMSCAHSLRYITVGSSRSVLSLLTWVPILLIQVPTTASVKEVRIAFASSRQFELDQPFIRWLASAVG
ncbi:hypothetical protein NMY22_g18844 [Coprinellus aureogranulatus]|nr:hypothetical protein NMY22_g18844 [Coprinellus aureogranulatus]